MLKPASVGIFVAAVLGFVAVLVSAQGANSYGISLPCCEAVSVLNVGPANSPVRGVVEFREDVQNNVVTVTGEIYGFQPNTQHGFHIHESGDLRNPENPCVSAGGHFNPHMVTHGAPGDSIRHIGDLGNIYADDNGVARINFQDAAISLRGPYSILGRAVVVHEKVDDLGRDGGDSKKTGNAGGRVACGVIGTIYKKP